MRTSRAALPAALLLALASPAAAQRGDSCPPIPREAADTTVFVPCQLDRAPAADAANEPPRYPEIMRSANVGGSVRARFVIDAAGRPEMGTFEAVNSSHELFTAAVRRALAEWRFTPGRRRGRAVRVALEREVVFDIAELGDSIPGTTVLAEEGSTAGGVPRLHLRWRRAERDTTVPPFDAQTERAIYAAALAAVIVRLPTDSAGQAQVICVGAHGGGGRWVEPDSTLLAGLARARASAVSSGGCWPKLVAVVRQPDSPGRAITLSPAGPAPYFLTAADLMRWNAALTRVQVWSRHRSVGTQYHCQVERSVSEWVAACRGSGVIWYGVGARQRSAYPLTAPASRAAAGR